MEQDGKITPNNDNGAGEGTPKTYNVKIWVDANGNPIMQQVDEKELVDGYLRQSDYTRKTQEIADEKKKLAGNWEGWAWATEVEEVKQFLNEAGFVTKDQLDEYIKGLKKEQSDASSIENVIASNTDLKQFEWAIRQIAKTDNSAIEDIVVKYGFSTHDKLAKAKASRWDLIGWSSKDDKAPKPVSEWTQEDWKTFREQNKKPRFS